MKKYEVKLHSEEVVEASDEEEAIIEAKQQFNEMRTSGFGVGYLKAEVKESKGK